MCPICADLIRAIERAQMDGDSTKERVLRAVLDNHRRECTGSHNVVVTERDAVTWPNGHKWVVAR